jgi:predicted enzyme related to lactoylglutathione lyase
MFYAVSPQSLEQEVHPMGNPFVHVELMSTDVGKAKAFYGKMFDWKLEDMDMGDMTYTMVKVGEGTGGGLMKNPMPNASSLWVAYVNVDDLEVATAKAKSLGATVVKDQIEVKGAGSFSIITDPTGAMLGLWQQKKG